MTGSVGSGMACPPRELPAWSVGVAAMTVTLTLIPAGTADPGVPSVGATGPAGGVEVVVGRSGSVRPQRNVVGAERGVVGAQRGDVAAEAVGVPFQSQDLPDPGQVDPVGHQLGDPPGPPQVVLTEASGSPRGARRVQQPVPFVEPQRADRQPGQLRGDRDAVHPGGRRRNAHPADLPLILDRIHDQQKYARWQQKSTLIGGDSLPRTWSTTASGGESGG